MEDDLSKIRSWVRLIQLLDVSEKAGLIPLPVLRLHTFAYLSNVLSQVWNMPVLDGKILKRRGVAFYPSLQQDLDRLVGVGVVLVSNLSHVRDEDLNWRLEGSYRLNREFADPIINRIGKFETERRFSSYLQELAYALSALTDEDIEKTVLQDATYSDPIVDVGNVVDFAEWQDLNYSANAALSFGQLLPNGAHATNGEMLHFYLRHLSRRLHGAY